MAVTSGDSLAKIAKHAKTLHPGILARRLAPWRDRSEWLREPLLHFVILGGVLFAADHFMVARSDDPRVIVVDAAVDAHARAGFQAGARARAQRRGAVRVAPRVARQRSAVPRRTRAAARQGRRRDPRARHLQAAERHRRRHEAPALRRHRAARVVREEPREVRRAGALRLPGGDPGRRQVREPRARLRERAERGSAGRRRRPTCACSSTDRATTWCRATVRSSRRRSMRRPSASGGRSRRKTVGAPCVSNRSRNRSPPTSKSIQGVVLHDWTDATLAEQRSAAVRALAKKYTIKVEAKTR